MTIIDRTDTGTRRGSDSASAQGLTSSGWHDDPHGLHRLRFYDGERWTDHVTHFGPTPCSGCRH